MLVKLIPYANTNENDTSIPKLYQYTHILTYSRAATTIFCHSKSIFHVVVAKRMSGVRRMPVHEKYKRSH